MAFVLIERRPTTPIAVEIPPADLNWRSYRYTGSQRAKPKAETAL
jgi:hypothetical protein